MPQLFLVLSALGAVFVLNALRPPKATIFALGSFFAGWLVSELAPLLLLLHVVGGASFALMDAIRGDAGLAAAVLWAVTFVGLVVLVRQGQRAGDEVESALVEGLGADYLDRIPPEVANRYDLRVPWRQLILPFLMRHPDVTRHRNIQYTGRGRRGRLNVYFRKDRPTGCPTLLQIHGGAWVIGNKDQQGIPLMLHLAARGWVCVAPNYRLSPRHHFPAHIVDVKRAIAWIREHGAEYGCDPGFIVITGGSAGGHLAALAALTPNDPEFQPGFEEVDTTVQAAIPYYGVYDMANETGTRPVRERVTRFLAPVVFRRRFGPDTIDEFRRAAPLNRVNREAPPFLVVHGRHDTLVPVEEARAFVERLRSVSQAPVVYAELPGTQHAFDVFPSIRTGHVIRAVERFVDYVYGQHIRPREERT